MVKSHQKSETPPEYEIRIEFRDFNKTTDNHYKVISCLESVETEQYGREKDEQSILAFVANKMELITFNSRVPYSRTYHIDFNDIITIRPTTT